MATCRNTRAELIKLHQRAFLGPHRRRTGPWLCLAIAAVALRSAAMTARGVTATPGQQLLVAGRGVAEGMVCSMKVTCSRQAGAAYCWLSSAGGQSAFASMESMSTSARFAMVGSKSHVCSGLMCHLLGRRWEEGVIVLGALLGGHGTFSTCKAILGLMQAELKQKERQAVCQQDMVMLAFSTGSLALQSESQRRPIEPGKGKT